MDRQNKAIALVLVGLIIGLSGAIMYQEHRHQTEINEVINITDGSGWGATITMSVFRDDVLQGEESHHNVITNALRSALRGHIADSTVALWTYIAIGTGTGGTAASTTLTTEFLRASGTYATVGSYNFTLTYTWTEGNFSGQTITEYGLFNDPTTGTMFNYSDDYSRGPLTADDVLQVTINCQIGS